MKDHSLSLVLALLLLIQLGFYLWGAWGEYVAEAQHQGEPLGLVDFLSYAGTEINLSTLADTYGALLIVLASKWLFERDSAESDPN